VICCAILAVSRRLLDKAEGAGEVSVETQTFLGGGQSPSSVDSLYSSFAFPFYPVFEAFTWPCNSSG
jgi:hypothetical protein